MRREEKLFPPNGHILAGNQRSGPVKVSVVGGGQGGSKIWRRERIEMTDPDLDDVAFLSGVYLTGFDSVGHSLFPFMIIKIKIFLFHTLCECVVCVNNS